MKKPLIYLLILILNLTAGMTTQASIRNVGVPAITNFPRQTYRASTQNWSVTQDSRGFMYFANNDGVLEYDGTSWNLYPFADPTLTRWVTSGRNGNLYTGMFNDFGIIGQNKAGKLTYTSLVQELPDSLREVGDVWRVYDTDEGIFFQTYSLLARFSPEGKLITYYTSPGNFRFSFYVGNTLYIQELGKGLLKYAHGGLEIIPGLVLPGEAEIWALHTDSYGNLILGTSDKGVYYFRNGNLQPWKGMANELLIKNQIFSSCRLIDGTLAFGTIRGGLLITSETGELLQIINRNNGLGNNTILSMATDNSGNLWLGLDNGISLIQINSPFSFLHHPDGFGAGYTAIVHQNHLYLGTNNGLFVANWPPPPAGEPFNFSLIPGSVGQVWYLGVHDGNLLCGHDNGTFLIEGTQLEKISDVKGAWKFIELKGHPDYLIGGTYQGLSLFRKTDLNKWKFVKPLDGFNESSRIMETDKQGTLWMTHGFKGAYKIRFNGTPEKIGAVEFFNTEAGFLSDNYINVYNIDGTPLFTSREGIFRYNPALNRFSRDTLFEKRFQTQEYISYLRQDNDKNIWFVAGNKPGVLRYQEDGSYALVSAPFQPLFEHMIGGFEYIYPLDQDNIFFGTEDGFAHYSPGNIHPADAAFSTYIRTITWTHTDTVIHGGNNWIKNNSIEPKPTAVPYRRNGLKITFSAPNYTGHHGIRYRYMLKDHQDNWTPWTESTSCEFSNLKEGLYHFNVQAIDLLGRISQSDSYSFRILPPWYRSALAYTLYILIAILIIFFSRWFILRRFEISKIKERQKQLLAYSAKEQSYQREALLAEKEIINLRNEQLRSSMIHRDKELANQTFHLIEKNKFLLKLKDELRKLNAQISEDHLTSRLNQLIRRIDKDIDNEKQWEVFETAFDDVHEDFMKSMKERYPQLTPRDLKLAAYLRMNLSTKEIAALMNISVRGVEISRYRLRKKIGLDRDMNLTSFVLEL
jgi:ligand-binding sensor domain-containing protein/DNA-binding CsgD family transcriptional regulator